MARAVTGDHLSLCDRSVGVLEQAEANEKYTSQRERMHTFCLHPPPEHRIRPPSLAHYLFRTHLL